MAVYLRGFADLVIDTLSKIIERVSTGKVSIAGAVEAMIKAGVTLATGLLEAFASWLYGWLSRTISTLVMRFGLQMAAGLNASWAKLRYEIQKTLNISAAGIQNAKTKMDIAQGLYDAISGGIDASQDNLTVKLSESWTAAISDAMNAVRGVVGDKYAEELKAQLDKLNAEYRDAAATRVSPAAPLWKSVRSQPPELGAMADSTQVFKALAAWNALSFKLQEVRNLEKEWKTLAASGDTTAFDQADAALKVLVADAQKLNTELYNVMRPQPKGLPMEEFTPLLQQMQAAVEGVNAELRAQGLDKWSAKWTEINAQAQKILDLVKDNAEQVAKITELRDKAHAGLTQAANLEKDAAAAQKFAETMRALTGDVDAIQFEIDTLGKSDLDKQVAKWTLALLELRKAAATTPEMIKALEAEIERLKTKGAERVAATAQDALDQANAAKWGGLAKDLSGSVFTGIADGFARGQKASKVWSNIVADVWQNSMRKAIDSLTGSIEAAFKELFSKGGALSGMAGIANGLIAIGGAIYSNINAKKTTTVDDFSEAINASEAVRGIVAGPTNVAIATMGDALKDAMRISEMLLTQIATNTRPLLGLGGGGGSMANAIYPLTGSTP